MSKPRRIALAITGASGTVYGLRVLEALLRQRGVEVHLTISKSAQQVLAVEQGIEIDVQAAKLSGLGVPNLERAVYHRNDNIGAALASGSFRLEALAVVPCSMGCVAAIAHGLSDDLIQRTADVVLKERRKLLLVPRETPFSTLHLENLLRLSQMGVVVLPACPGFYGKPQSIDDMVNFIVARVLDHLGVEHDFGPRWGERL
ncbi:MAG TPA: flavin prenyltransferase UbiX [Planctomycetota bacterium]|jgi:4-hydroxy-3-polyprenylbenzoate decarboxylase